MPVSKDAVRGGASFDGIMFNGIVRESVFQGESAFVIVETDVEGEADVEMAVRFGTGIGASAGDLADGQRIAVGLHREDVIVIPQEPA